MLNLKIPTEVLLSVATVPLVLGLLGSRALANLFRDLGQASEEIFRGDRLPILIQQSSSIAQVQDSEAISEAIVEP
jgi:hypothetical protein